MATGCHQTPPEVCILFGQFHWITVYGLFGNLVLGILLGEGDYCSWRWRVFSDSLSLSSLSLSLCRTWHRSWYQRLCLCISITVAPAGLLHLPFLQVLIPLSFRFLPWPSILPPPPPPPTLQLTDILIATLLPTLLFASWYENLTCSRALLTDVTTSGGLWVNHYENNKKEIRRTEQANSALLKNCVALFNMYALLCFCCILSAGGSRLGLGFVVFLSSWEWKQRRPAHRGRQQSFVCRGHKVQFFSLPVLHHVNWKCRFNQLLTQCINEQQAKNLPNIDMKLKVTYRKQKGTCWSQ